MAAGSRRGKKLVAEKAGSGELFDSQLFLCVGTEALRGPGRGPHHVYIYVADAGELLDS